MTVHNSWFRFINSFRFTNSAVAVAPSSPQNEGLIQTGEPVFLIRTVRPQDLVSIAEVLTSSFHSQEGSWGWLYPILRVGIYEDLRNRLYTRKHHYACLVAVLRDPNPLTHATGLGDRPIGTVEISLKQSPFYLFHSHRYLYLSNLAVEANYRRQGVAQQLLQMAERTAIDWGFRELYLHVLENNHPAKRLYWKAGYRLKSVETHPIGLILGRPRQLLLVKQLANEPRHG